MALIIAYSLQSIFITVFLLTQQFYLIEIYFDYLHALALLNYNNRLTKFKLNSKSQFPRVYRPVAASGSFRAILTIS